MELRFCQGVADSRAIREWPWRPFTSLSSSKKVGKRNKTCGWVLLKKAIRKLYSLHFVLLFFCSFFFFFNLLKFKFQSDLIFWNCFYCLIINLIHCKVNSKTHLIHLQTTYHLFLDLLLVWNITELQLVSEREDTGMEETVKYLSCSMVGNGWAVVTSSSKLK